MEDATESVKQVKQDYCLNIFLLQSSPDFFVLFMFWVNISFVCGL